MLAAVAAASVCRADDRQFTFLDMAKVTAPGQFEFEQWIDWEHRTPDAHNSNVFILKEELEIGVSDKLMFGVDIPEWHFQTSPEDQKQGPRFDTIGGEFRYRFLNPTKDVIGLALKGEIELGPRVRGAELRGIVQKNFDRFTLLYNLTLESEWSKGEDEDNAGEAVSDGEVVQALGGSVEITPNWFAGAELVHEIPMPDWHTGHQQNVFLGPNLSYHASFVNGRNWALTGTTLFRVTDSDEEPSLRFRLIFEFDF
jgi:hypothetical protein